MLDPMRPSPIKPSCTRHLLYAIAYRLPNPMQRRAPVCVLQSTRCINRTRHAPRCVYVGRLGTRAGSFFIAEHAGTYFLHLLVVYLSVMEASAALNLPSYTDAYAANYAATIVACERVGTLGASIMTFRCPAGSYHNGASSDFAVTMVENGGYRAHFDFGMGPFSVHI